MEIFDFILEEFELNKRLWDFIALAIIALALLGMAIGRTFGGKPKSKE